MIFVTVGTHEQQFDRLIKYMDDWAENNDEKVVIQIGYSNYEPRHCEWKKLYPYESMIAMMKKARIVITHGGPSSFILVNQLGKIPLVVPRKKEFYEHVNNHQLDFCSAVADRYNNIVLIKDVDTIDSIILQYKEIVENMKVTRSSNNEKFCTKFSSIVTELMR